VKLVSERPDLDIDRLLQTTAFFQLCRPGARAIHGLIHRVAQGECRQSALTRLHNSTWSRLFLPWATAQPAAIFQQA